MRDIARRSLLASISAIPAATMAVVLPSAVLAHPAADQDTIAKARRVLKLAAIDLEATNCFGDAYDARDADPEGLARAERLATRTSENVERAATALALTCPLSLPGIVAKAEAFQAIQASGWKGCAVSWRDDLAASIVADVLRIGGQANV
ncbi:hypothetical protein P7D22_19760 [Lichenihabitans sp. Uapishka_5]|uniref:hypothetical protein n=1 Tax=Lichenihabitans sp. Uapishka_5 TaxID=3037302 RepID=UPI0029E7F452|nr:hypothetical protein [Lichenihabitans sp. Uapishka_5]MDX7953405.1 hypothetical protein [Lichenihabitans sp. Uapishka_5]